MIGRQDSWAISRTVGLCNFGNLFRFCAHITRVDIQNSKEDGVSWSGLAIRMMNDPIDISFAATKLAEKVDSYM